jgi:hypothetical protein
MTERYSTKTIRVTLSGKPPFIAENLVGLSVAAAHYPDATALEVVDALPAEVAALRAEVQRQKDGMDQALVEVAKWSAAFGRSEARAEAVAAAVEAMAIQRWAAIGAKRPCEWTTGATKQVKDWHRAAARAEFLLGLAHLRAAGFVVARVPDAKGDVRGYAAQVDYADGWDACRAAMIEGDRP